MATWQSSYQYRDPEKLDISVLGKAMQYKQGMYDQNVAQVQQMVNQYAGTDLLKDIDKQYFGDRIKTIVDYVNQSGTRDWSRKSIAQGIQNYVSGAIDNKVTSAIASTMQYRKQMAEIEDIKKNKPDQYSMQNEWFATQDFKRYMNSKDVGDSYRAQTYVPYTDVNKLLLDNAKKLQEFGVEYHFDPIGGNQYFTKMGTYERISEQDARQYMGMILDTKAKNQLYIDGQYTYKDMKPENIDAQYNDRLDTAKKFNNEQIAELKLQRLGASKNDKVQIDASIAKYETTNKNIDVKKSMNIGTSAKIDELYQTDFTNKWIDFLSYDKLKDWKMDQSGYELEKWRNDVANAEWDKQQKINEFQYKAAKDSADREFDRYKLGVEASMKGFKINPDGSVSIDPNNPASATLFGKDLVTDLNQVNKPDPLKVAQADFNKASGDLESSVVENIQSILNDPNNSSLKKELSGISPKHLAWMLVNSPSKSALLMDNLSDANKTIIDRVRESKNRLTAIDDSNDGIVKDLKATAESMLSSDKESTRKAIYKATDLHIIDNNGNVVKGDLKNNKGKYDDLTKKIAGINLALMGGDNSPEEEEQLRRMITTEVNKSTLSTSQKKKVLENMMFKTKNSGFLNTASSMALSILPDSGSAMIGMASKGIGNILTSMTGNETYGRTGEKINNKINDLNGFNPNTESAVERLKRYANQRLNPNQKLSDLGANSIWSVIKGNDVDTSKLKERGIDIDNIGDRIRNNMKRTSKILEQNYTTTLGKRFDIPFTTKAGEAMMSQFSTMLPVGTEIQKDGVANIIIDKNTGTAQVTMAVKKEGKGEKGYQPVTTTVKVSELPTQILNQIDFSEKEQMYSSKNPFAVKYNTAVSLPESKSDWYEKVQLMPEEKRQQALNNPPAFQQDILSKILASYDPSIVAKHADEIEKIVSKPVSISTEVNGGTWTTVGRIGGEAVYQLPTNMTTYDPKLMDNARNAIATETILEKIKQVLK